VREGTVHAVIRHYRGNTQLFDELERRTDEVEQVIRGVAGFVSYSLVRTDDGGGFSVSVYADESGTAESTRVAADWVRQNVPQATGSPPEVIEGRVILQLGA
jgi:heme-degrading monooxygenase HmoA